MKAPLFPASVPMAAICCLAAVACQAQDFALAPGEKELPKDLACLAFFNHEFDELLVKRTDAVHENSSVRADGDVLSSGASCWQDVLYSGVPFAAIIATLATTEEAERGAASSGSWGSNAHDMGIWPGAECPGDSCWWRGGSQGSLTVQWRNMWVNVHARGVKGGQSLSGDALKQALLLLSQRVLDKAQDCPSVAARHWDHLGLRMLESKTLVEPEYQALLLSTGDVEAFEPEDVGIMSWLNGIVEKGAPVEDPAYVQHLVQRTPMFSDLYVVLRLYPTAEEALAAAENRAARYESTEKRTASRTSRGEPVTHPEYYPASCPGDSCWYGWYASQGDVGSLLVTEGKLSLQVNCFIWGGERDRPREAGLPWLPAAAAAEKVLEKYRATQGGR